MLNFFRRKSIFYRVLLICSIILTIFLLLCYSCLETQPYVYRVNRKSKNLEKFSKEIHLPRILSTVKCIDRERQPSIEMRGNYLVLYNYVKATKNFKCHESITYTTMGDFRFLEYLKFTVDRWKGGPVSVAVYAPGDDFPIALSTIAYLRNCLDNNYGDLIKQLVTFHMYLDADHLPFGYDDLFLEMYNDDNVNCSADPPHLAIRHNETYKFSKNLLFPINVGRNVARSAAQTHFVLASDIELYPSSDFIEKFLAMVAYNPEYFEKDTRAVFVLPVFEISENESVPETKTELQTMFKDNKSFWFHKSICPSCHTIPEEDFWMNEPEGETYSLNVLIRAKRYGDLKNWEPFYVGTNMEPAFDERLTWEGRSNKMPQAYEMCLLGYDYMILDNAFLVHAPGVKVLRTDDLDSRQSILRKTEDVLDKILVELKKKYGRNRKCFLSWDRN